MIYDCYVISFWQRTQIDVIFGIKFDAKSEWESFSSRESFIHRANALLPPLSHGVAFYHVIIQNINIIAIMSSAFGLYLSSFIFISRREHTRSKTMNRCINISGSGSRPPPILSDLNWHTHMHRSPNKQQSFLVNHNRRATQQQWPSRKDERTNHNQQATALKREFHSKYFH